MSPLRLARLNKAEDCTHEKTACSHAIDPPLFAINGVDKYHR
jgi:hypothetical protein